MKRFSMVLACMASVIIACDRKESSPPATPQQTTPAPTPAPADAAPQHADPEAGWWQLEYRSASPLTSPGNPCYTRTQAGGESSATITSSMSCGNQPWTGVVAGRWSTPPVTLVPGERLQMAAAGRASASHGGITASSNLDVAFNRANCGRVNGAVEIVRVNMATHGGDGPTPSATGEGIVPGRYWGRNHPGLEDKLKLNVCMDQWQVYFIYAWQPGQAPARPPTIPPKVAIPPSPEDDPHPERKVGIWRDGWRDSGVRFSDLSGQVEWRAADDEEGWQFAKLDQPLPVGAHIRTSERSSVILSFADMTTFTQRPETEIILGDPAANDSVVKLLAGNLWINIRKMVKDGSMDIEMSQAVAGGRGTIFQTLEKPGRSETSVCEGKVILTPRKGAEAIELAPGDRAVVTENGIERMSPGIDAICAAFAKDHDAVYPGGIRPAWAR
jgi:hypothetical protein